MSYQVVAASGSTAPFAPPSKRPKVTLKEEENHASEPDEAEAWALILSGKLKGDELVDAVVAAQERNERTEARIWASLDSMSASIREMTAILTRPSCDPLAYRRLPPPEARALANEDILALRHCVLRGRNTYLQRSDVDAELSKQDEEALEKTDVMKVVAATRLSLGAAAYICRGSQLQPSAPAADRSFTAPRIIEAFKRTDIKKAHGMCLCEIFEFSQA